MFVQSRRAVVVVALLLVVRAAIHAEPPVEDPHPDVPGYMKGLKSPSAAVRKESATALGALGTRARNAVPALRAALLDPDEAVQVAAAEALAKINRPVKKPAAEDDSPRALEEQLKTLREELAKARARVREREEKLKELTNEAEAQQKKAIEALKKAEELAKKARDLEQALKEHGGKAANPGGDRFPAEKIEGIVKLVDDKSGLVKINVGKDAGLAKGHSMYVFRLAPRPLYLGELRIIDVDAREATARPILAQRGSSLKVGDQITSQLPGQPKK